MGIDRLSAEDRLMLQVDATWPQDVGALLILDGEGLLDDGGDVRIDALREAIEARLHQVPRFRQMVSHPRRGLGGALWLDAPGFDINQHVHVRRLPANSDDADLLLTTERLRRRRLDMSRPLWEMWFLPGLPQGRVGLFVRMHHAIGDGRAAMTMLAAFLDTVPRPGTTSAGSAPSWTPAPPPSTGELLGDNLLRRLRGLGRGLSALIRPWTTVRQILRAWPAMQEVLAEKPGSKTSIDRLIGPGRNLAVVRSSVEQVRRIARAHDASVNDVLLAAIAGGLRTLLLARGEPVEGVTLRIFVPVSLRGRLRGTVQGNQISQMAVPLALGSSDAAARLRQIAAETVLRKPRSRISLGTLFGIGFVRRLLLKAIIGQRVNVTSASIPGPRRPLYLAGARVLEIFPMLNLVGNEPLGVGALSYAGTFNIGVVADQDAFPDIDVFTVGLRRELDALAEAPLVGRRAERPSRAAARLPVTV